MNINTTTLGRLTGPHAANAPSAGDGSFQAAYARVAGENRTPVVRESAPENQTASTVHAGDTLYGIVRARLAKMGVDVNAKAATQAVQQVAQANHIRNPDRIYVGQKIDLAGLASTFGAGQATPPARGIDNSITIASGSEPLPHLRWEEPAPETEVTFAAEEAAEPPATIAEVPPDDLAAAFNAASAARQAAVYEQNAALAPDKPAEPAGKLPDIFYKGVVGKALDAMPLEPETRATLQKTSSVVSGTFTVRSLGALAGLGGPLLTIAGLIWGIFSSRQIDPAVAGSAKAAGETKQVDAPKPADDAVQTARN